MSKGKRETKDSKRKGKRQGDMEELDCGWGGGTQQKGLGGQYDGLMHLLAQRAMMMIMRMMIHTTRDS